MKVLQAKLCIHLHLFISFAHNCLNLGMIKQNLLL